MRKNPHGKILKGKSKEQHLNTVPKSCSSSKDRTYGKPHYETLIILPLFFKWQNLATKLDNLQPYSIFFLLGVNFDKSTIELDFFSYILHDCKICRKLKINKYVINKLFKLQVFIV